MNIASKITVVIVLYNSSEVIFECLKTLNNFKIIVVDNGKNSKILEKLKSKQNIQIISPGKNIGMGRGANFAFNSIKSEFFLLLSPDTKIDENSISKLLSTALNYDDCAIAAPLNVTDSDSYGVFLKKENYMKKIKSNSY